MIAYLDAAFEENDAALVVAALGDIARSRGMAHVYQALSGYDNPELGAVLKVMRALGLRLQVSGGQ